MTLKHKTGSPLHLGTSETRSGLNFAIFSDQATELQLQLFELDDTLIHKIILHPDINRTGAVWHIELEGLPTYFSYSYQVLKTNDTSRIAAPQAELLDPYARAVSGMSHWGARKDTPIRALWGPHHFDFEGDRPINRPLKDSIIYELHVRGFTQSPSSKVQHPGTFQGVIEKIPYLKSLGITAVELMPINEFDETDCPFLDPDSGERHRNYWGYSSLNFFSIKSGYSSNQEPMGVIQEFKKMVRALHKADIEVILDVVFNHTAEGGTGGKSYNFKGLSNKSYYIQDAKADYANYSGCGNTLNCNHPVVRTMILDALRYFVAECHVDGFRFDLASILSRDEKGQVLNNPPVLEIIAKDPILAHTKIIAEAWDAAGLYQVGSFPASGRWAEWNGRYRDCIRAFSRGDKHRTSELATRIAGSEDLYKHSKRNPYHSINFITSHDGFTLMDLVSYQEKHNHKNGEHNRDGDNHNISQNFGFEGHCEQPEIQQLRMRQICNLLTLLVVSQGTPMILMGDEFGRTQKGNNNTWCQDNPLGWIDWDLMEKNQALLLFVRQLFAFRKKHPNLKRECFFSGKTNPVTGLADLSWHAQQAWEPEFEHGNNKLAFMIDAYAQEKRMDDCIYVAMNFEQSPKTFELPRTGKNQEWTQVLDTYDPSLFTQGKTKLYRDSTHQITLQPLSIQLFLHP